MCAPPSQTPPNTGFTTGTQRSSGDTVCVNNMDVVEDSINSSALDSAAAGEMWPTYYLLYMRVNTVCHFLACFSHAGGETIGVDDQT